MCVFDEGPVFVLLYAINYISKMSANLPYSLAMQLNHVNHSL